jgi:hypothetical protein
LINQQITDFIQAELRRRGLKETTAVEAAAWLDRGGLVTDRKERPGAPLRKLLRDGAIGGAEQRPKGSHGRWFIRVSGAKAPEPNTPTPVPKASAQADVLTENDVVDAVCEFLVAADAEITERATTMQRGPDIVATLGARSLIVEAKGATSSKSETNRFGKRFGRGQVGHHVARAFFTCAALVGDRADPTRLAAMALPDGALHRAFADHINVAREKLGIGLFWVDGNKKVQLEATWAGEAWLAG